MPLIERHGEVSERCGGGVSFGPKPPPSAGAVALEMEANLEGNFRARGGRFYGTVAQTDKRVREMRPAMQVRVLPVPQCLGLLKNTCFHLCDET